MSKKTLLIIASILFSNAALAAISVTPNGPIDVKATVGETSKTTITVTSPGATANLGVQMPTIPTGVTVEGGASACVNGTSLPANGSCTLTFDYNPTAVTSAPESLPITITNTLLPGDGQNRTITFSASNPAPTPPPAPTNQVNSVRVVLSTACMGSQKWWRPNSGRFNNHVRAYFTDINGSGTISGSLAGKSKSTPLYLQPGVLKYSSIVSGLKYSDSNAAVFSVTISSVWHKTPCVYNVVATADEKPTHLNVSDSTCPAAEASYTQGTPGNENDPGELFLKINAPIGNTGC